ncbi:MAG: hypothetical protein EWV55_18345 [Microcystis viridis Mv_BB_P_19951000_S69]|uniref:Uncharacterized protein n=1 Tax=Microcystis viridis Mv_BB_P_19951000_S68D TaxID=2486270 RepID=A0A552HTB4_MICVR|nr:MAG: hypothetical protein EWV55_18345 [Microcystis viridis Mv_BB_P_19951000_S69]TRU71562.1 MAG: hypothetical protein EWV47_16635 [Microcystis viridis Mv_BB_P_19951000_S68]TRU74465.1 MAG: hypothetical protein EWV77_10175 [Microcystis viridis Mv_BB_P_19951000_S68D]TRU83037.1 MAG: hypothetical protein EWV46_17505 [Microcystis viridis Mv_BB_P_19951000_S69D]
MIASCQIYPVMLIELLPVPKSLKNYLHQFL